MWSAARCAMQHSPNPAPAFAVSPSDGRGLGGYAVSAIAAGDLIIEEPPLVKVATQAGAGDEMFVHLGQAAKALDQPEHGAFFSLCHSAPPASPVEAEHIARANAFSICEPGAEDSIAVFHSISRLNHSCRPCARHGWDGARGVKTVRALRPISPGEEITISYLGNESILQLGRERRRQALSRLGFDCSCSRCERGDDVDDALWRTEVSAAAEVLRDAEGDPILIWSPEVFLRCSGAAVAQPRVEGGSAAGLVAPPAPKSSELLLSVLPIELQRLVLHRLPIYTLLAARASCADWRDVADEPALWGRLALDVWGQEKITTMAGFADAADHGLIRWNGPWNWRMFGDVCYIQCKHDGSVVISHRMDHCHFRSLLARRLKNQPKIICQGNIINGVLLRLTHTDGSTTDCRWVPATGPGHWHPEIDVNRDPNGRSLPGRFGSVWWREVPLIDENGEDPLIDLDDDEDPDPVCRSWFANAEAETMEDEPSNTIMSTAKEFDAMMEARPFEPHRPPIPSRRNQGSV